MTAPAPIRKKPTILRTSHFRYASVKVTFCCPDFARWRLAAVSRSCWRRLLEILGLIPPFHEASYYRA